MPNLSPSHGRPLHDAAFARIVEAAASRFTTILTRETPALGARVLPWLASLSRTGSLADYFLHPRYGG